MKKKVITKVDMHDLQVGDFVHYKCGGICKIENELERKEMVKAYHTNGVHKNFKIEGSDVMCYNNDVEVIAIERYEETFQDILEEVQGCGDQMGPYTKKFMIRILKLLV